MIDLNGKHALVCGSTQGIGRACAERLATQGAQITLVARDEKALHAVVGALPRTRGAAHDVVVADFRDPPAMRARVAEHIARTAPVQILINNTGGPAGGPLLEASPDELLAAYQMHLICGQLLVQTLAPGMKAARFGRIINIISTSVREPIPGLGVSNTTRWAVAAWAKTLSRELAPYGITVNNILPGFTDTERLKTLFETRAAREGRSLADVTAEAMRAVPTGRFARPDEIAAAVAFLASDEASYVNGVSLAVDGGRLGSM